jgi:hypothetical protein
MLLYRSEEQNREQMANTALVDAGDCRFAACAIFEHFSGIRVFSVGTFLEGG